VRIYPESGWRGLGRGRHRDTNETIPVRPARDLS
jgi:hypothetical protein